MLDTMEIPPHVSAAFAAMPPRIRARLDQTRAEIFAEAERLGVRPIEETLKWGQPAYVPPRKSGTTIRLGQLAGEAALFVHCQTSIIEDARELFGGIADFKDNRALVLGGDARATTHVICAALTYHRKGQSAAR